MMRKHFTTVLDKVITASNEHIDQVEPSIISDYEKLNEKCDTVIAKIKTRKEKVSKTEPSEG